MAPEGVNDRFEKIGRFLHFDLWKAIFLSRFRSLESRHTVTKFIHTPFGVIWVPKNKGEDLTALPFLSLNDGVLAPYSAAMVFLKVSRCLDCASIMRSR